MQHSEEWKTFQSSYSVGSKASRPHDANFDIDWEQLTSSSTVYPTGLLDFGRSRDADPVPEQIGLSTAEYLLLLFCPQETGIAQEPFRALWPAATRLCGPFLSPGPVQ